MTAFFSQIKDWSLTIISEKKDFLSDIANVKFGHAATFDMSRKLLSLSFTTIDWVDVKFT